jgi:general secretion pathway protein A
MYQRFFHLTCEPFGVTPDPRFFYMSTWHVEAAASLYYAITERRGFAALIAPPGLGKTSVIVSLLDRLREQADVVFIVHPRLDGEALLESVLSGLGVNPDSDSCRRARQLAEHLAELDRRGRTCVVILDEAQNLSTDALETVRMLSNFEVPGRKLIQFLFVGQPALATLLKRPECEQIRQRINVVARLEPLAASDVAGYIEHRLKVAGASQNPFTPAAVQAIASASAGVPRVVNTLCFSALTLAFAANTRSVTEAYVAEAVTDLSLDAPVSVTHQRERTQSSQGPVLTVPASAGARTPAVAAALLLIAVVIATFALWGDTPQDGRRAAPARQQLLTGGNAS